MASDIATQHLFANQKLKLYDHDPGATTAIIVSPDGGTPRVADMSLFSRFACGAMVTVPASGHSRQLVQRGDPGVTLGHVHTAGYEVKP